MNFAIETMGLTADFRARHGMVRALDGLSLKVQVGSVFGFLGPNGAGKTTTMHILLGFIAPTSGMARIFDCDVQHSIARQRIGYLPEHPDTYRFLTGHELLTASGRLFRMRGRALHNRVDAVLSMVDLEVAAKRRVGTYSRGMLQRICLAQALINDPDLVILDEPTGGLDPFGRLQIRKIIADLRDRGKTVFFSSHELSEVELVCDRMAIIDGGRILAEGATDKLVPPDKSLEKYFMETVTQSRQQR